MSGTYDIYERLEASCERINLPVAEDASTHTVWRCWGDGLPVVLLHGDWGSWTHFIRNIDVLAARYRVLVPDMPGYGDSGFPPLDDVVADSTVIMAADIDKLIGKNVDYNIVGFSYGGIHAAHMAALHSGRVGKVVLIGAGGMGIDAPVLYKRPMQRLSCLLYTSPSPRDS